LKLLLDTNAFIWASREPNRLTAKARRAVSDPYNERFVSIASLWEMQIKHGLGKLSLPANIDDLARSWIRPLAAQILPVQLRHLGRLYRLAPAHRDPFDRILVAQAIDEDMSIVTADEAFNLYSAPVVW